MSGPSVPRSEHAAKASGFFARLVSDAHEEGDPKKGQEKETIATGISNKQEDGKRITYQPDFLMTFKTRYTDRPPQLPTSGIECLLTGPRPLRGHDQEGRERVKLNVRDLAALRHHRNRRSATAAEFMANLRQTTKPPPGLSPTAGRRQHAASPTVSWRKREEGHKPSSAPSSPRVIKRDHLGRRTNRPPPADEEEEDFEAPSDEEPEEDKLSWRKKELVEEARPATGEGAPKVWTPRRRLGALDKNQEIYSQVKGILNKLSADNFHQLCAQLFAIEMPSLECLQGIVGIIFDKATLEPTFCSLYAQLCADWSDKAPKFKEPETDRDMTFRRALLNKCQEMFERKKDEELPAKRVMIGNIIFIGELYRKKLITHKIIHICLTKLMDSVMGAIAKKNEQGSGVPREEDVECLCKLFIIVGRDLDALSTDSRKRMQEYFRALNRIVLNKTLPARIRFLVQDVVEFRQAGWQLRTKQAAK